MKAIKLSDEPLQRRVHFNRYIAHIRGILSQFKQTQQVLANYPDLDDGIDDWVDQALWNLLHDYADSDVKDLLEEHLGLGVIALARVQRHCAMVTFVDKKRYNKLFQAVTHKHRESALNYIKRFHKAKTMAASVGNKYSEEDLMQTFVDNFQSPGKYAAQQVQQHSELRKTFKAKTMGLLFG